MNLSSFKSKIKQVSLIKILLISLKLKAGRFIVTLKEHFKLPDLPQIHAKGLFLISKGGLGF